VAYPFAVDGLNRPDYCSSPGHRLFCINATTPVIYMSSGGSFQFTGVDYVNHVVTVVDKTLTDQTSPHNYRNTTIDSAVFAYTDRDRFLTAYVNCSSATSSLPLLRRLLLRHRRTARWRQTFWACAAPPWSSRTTRTWRTRGRRQRRVLGEVDGRRRVVRRVPGLRWALRAR
jgi:hypothetical protein